MYVIYLEQFFYQNNSEDVPYYVPVPIIRALFSILLRNGEKETQIEK